MAMAENTQISDATSFNLPRAAAFSEYRADGWPYCPACGEDELYSLEIPATIETIQGCYKFGWTAEEFRKGVKL